MNRAERRRQKNITKVATYNLTLEQIDARIQAAIPDLREKIQHEAVAAITSVFLVCLHDEYGFGKKRLQTLLDRFNRTYDCIEVDGSLKVEDFYKTCREEFDIVIKEGY